MKRFTKILICLMLFVVGFAFVACDNRTTKEKNFVYPSRNDQVIGNGGLAVKKGNYLYFVNGFRSVDDISNKKASYTVGSLLLMKLGENGEVVTDEDGLLKDEYYITMSSALCGYEATNLFIFGDYLYFVSPCLENESGDKVWAKERVVFNRIKLDKTGKVETVYESGVKYDQLEYEFYQENSSLYILAWEKGDSYYNNSGKNALIRINATSKSNSKISNNVSSVVFGENANEIFYVEDDSENSSYYLKQYNIANNETTDYTSFDKTITAKFVADDKVYITKAHDYGSSTDLLVSNISNVSGFELVYAFEADADLKITPDGRAIVMAQEKTISLIRKDEEVVTIVDEDATAISVIGFTNGCVVYYDTKDDNSTIKCVSYDNMINDGTAEIETLTTVEAFEEDTTYFDISSDDSYIYFYNMEGSHYYLFRLEVKNNLDEKEEMIGVYLEEDAPEIEEDSQEEEE